MLNFDLHTRQAVQPVSLQPSALVVAGWTGRDEAALRHHIEELAAIGVPRPSSVPVFYRNSLLNLTQAPVVEVLGPDTSGEVEPVIVALGDRLCLAVGSDHTDRKAETQGIALSKQLCAKPIGSDLWALEDIAGHWDRLQLRSFATIDGKRVAYQDGTLSGMRPPADLIARYGSSLKTDSVMYCGTLAAIGGIRPASRFELELEDPVLGRMLRHAYDIDALPVIS
ncbi:DUF2848 domain-containing protein [Bradyrhizobium sp. S69]|uniref:DUF2848 domain-containing protein n=1 Tax=Bradyrhizobium sp. S69 TaxID=1641856 RepID=UPI00131BE4E9|nr:DUF2848 domain-containing protein [Bradyrhizobium sp. S69]